MKKKYKCSVCGHKFTINKASVYLVQDEPTVIDFLTGKKITVFNAVDCPNCGCQTILEKRVPAMVAVITPSGAEIKFDPSEFKRRMLQVPEK